MARWCGMQRCSSCPRPTGQDVLRIVQGYIPHDVDVVRGGFLMKIMRYFFSCVWSEDISLRTPGLYEEGSALSPSTKWLHSIDCSSRASTSQYIGHQYIAKVVWTYFLIVPLAEPHVCPNSSSSCFPSIWWWHGQSPTSEPHFVHGVIS